MATLLDTPRGESGTIDRKTNSYVTSPSTALTSSTLTPQAPLQITQPKPATQAAGFGGFMEANASQLQQQRSQVQQSKDDFLTSILKSDTETGLQDKLYAKEVDPAEAELTDINNHILAEQHSTRRRIEALRKNPQGLFGGALESEVNKIETESIAKQADLSIIQMARQGRYDSAKAIADRAVTAILEKQRNRNEALRFNYEENKELFNKEEQRAFETAQSERERQLDNEEYRLRATFQQKIDQQNSAYAASLKDTTDEGDSEADILAYTQALQAGTATLAQVPQKLRGQVLKNVQDTGTNKLLGLLGQYRDTINGKNFLTANLPQTRALIDTLKGQITAVYKQQQQLGTLDNGVQKLVDRIIPDPGNLSLSSLSNKAQIDAIDNFIANQGGGTSSAPTTEKYTVDGVVYVQGDDGLYYPE